MPNTAVNYPATDITGKLSGLPTMSLDEVDIQGLWLIQSNKTLKLKSLASTVFNQGTKMGSMLKANGLRLIQLTPGKAYLFSDQFRFPYEAQDFENIATDISHGFCQLLLSGDDSLGFLNAYTTVDLEDEAIITARCVRTRLGQYAITLWWDRLSDIHIMVDRSLARSLGTYLHALSIR